jgi:hypothetical protein
VFGDVQEKPNRRWGGGEILGKREKEKIIQIENQEKLSLQLQIKES